MSELANTGNALDDIEASFKAHLLSASISSYLNQGNPIAPTEGASELTNYITRNWKKFTKTSDLLFNLGLTSDNEQRQEFVDSVQNYMPQLPQTDAYGRAIGDIPGDPLVPVTVSEYNVVIPSGIYQDIAEIMTNPNLSDRERDQGVYNLLGPITDQVLFEPVILQANVIPDEIQQEIQTAFGEVEATGTEVPELTPTPFTFFPPTKDIEYPKVLEVLKEGELFPGSSQIKYDELAESISTGQKTEDEVLKELKEARPSKLSLSTIGQIVSPGTGLSPTPTPESEVVEREAEREGGITKEELANLSKQLGKVSFRREQERIAERLFPEGLLGRTNISEFRRVMEESKKLIETERLRSPRTVRTKTGKIKKEPAEEPEKEPEKVEPEPQKRGREF
jgi:hypothetical protein